MGFLRNLIFLIRVRDWIDAMETNFVSSLMLLFSTQWIQQNFFFLFIFISYQCFFFSFAYLANLHSDREGDRLCGKLTLELPSLAQVYSVLIILASAALIILFWFGNIEAVLLGAISLLSGIIYSFKPLRLKERGIWGVLVPAISQRPLSLLLFSFLVGVVNLSTCYLGVWVFLIGLSSIIRHQIVDIKPDALVGVKTWTVEVGRDKAKKVLDYIVMILPVYGIFALFLYPLYVNLVVLSMIMRFNWDQYYLTKRYV